MVSRAFCVRWLTCDHVRCNLWIGAVPKAEMIDVNVEKLFICRHFWMGSAGTKGSDQDAHICDGDKVFDYHYALLHIGLVQDHLRDPISQLI